MVERPPTVAPAGRYLELRYEDLVGDPSTALHRVVDFLGLRWDDALLRHAELPHTLFDNPYAHPSAEPAAEALSPAKVARHRRDLTAEQITEFERLAGHELTRLGYPLTGSLVDGSRRQTGQGTRPGPPQAEDGSTRCRTRPGPTWWWSAAATTG